ncbi:hypothetical protein [Xenorhabdus entomophaga]|uniref:hypothetical protein n=1 Tax=Xenorhabdus entomophaga TaxID=3136257 RepID=UPI0030F47E8B
MEAPNCTIHHLIIRIYSGLTEVSMYPATISYSYVEIKNTVRHGRNYITYPVRIYIMDEQAKSAGRAAYQRNLAT